MSFPYNHAASLPEAFIDQFYYNAASHANTSPVSATPPSAIPLTGPSAAMVSPSNTHGWAMPFDYAAAPLPAAVGSAMQSPVKVGSPEDSPLSLSPRHASSASSSPHQQLLSPFQTTTANPNSPAMLTEWTLHQRQRQLQQQHHELQQQLQLHHLQQQQQSQQYSPPANAQQSQGLQPFLPNTAALMAFNSFTNADFQTSPLFLSPPPPSAAAVGPNAGLDSLAAYNGLPVVTNADVSSAMTSQAITSQALTSQAMSWSLANWQDFDTAIVMPAAMPTHGLQHTRIGSLGSLGSMSPTNTTEIHSLGSSDLGWSTVDMFPRFDTFATGSQEAIFNPGQTLHLRSNSGSSHAKSEANTFEFGSYEEISFPPPFSPLSQGSDHSADISCNCFHGDAVSPGHQHQHQHHHGHHHGHQHHHSHEIISPSANVAPMPIKASASAGTSSRHSPVSGSGVGSTSSSVSASPPVRRTSGVRKSPVSARPSKAVIRRASTGKDGRTGEKKVGRRRGPLLPEQRKQASEIRKLRACLRCKFLKKTCDKGEPCAGCQPSHARLWQVPCTRIDIKDVNYFMKDWKADYERHLDRGVSVFNVKGFAPTERLMWITHGYGFCLPISVREVYVADASCFQIDWVESHLQDQEPIEFDVRTEHLDVGQEGVSMEKLSEYLDRHIDGPFETFIDDHFDGTPFVTEILKTAYRFYQRQGLPVIRKALKLVLAYNLTMHITLVEQHGSEEQQLEGQIDDEDSKYYGKVVAPVMINFQIKCAMADLWRELQKEILEELSALYSSVYSGDRLKNWPTIFMLAAILLIVWEEMQFDCHYRVPDAASVDKFCADMEGTPVGVVVGLFHAISQKLPPFTEWDTKRHGQVLNNNEAVCDAMTEVRQHIKKHEAYLRARPTSTGFDRYDFDSLSNKFLSKLVIRAN